jgi:hypothetical protein
MGHILMARDFGTPNYSEWIFLSDLKMMPVFRGNYPLDFLMEAVCVLPISLFHPSLNGVYTKSWPMAKRLHLLKCVV